MPRHCSAAGCKSRDTRETRKAGITFHRLPKRGRPRRSLWIINSGRTGPQGKGQWDPQSRFIYFCSKHFTPESFELSGVSGYRRLKEDAVPTVFERFLRQRRSTSAKAQKGGDSPVPTNRQIRKKPRSLKQEEGKLAQDSQQAVAGGQDAENTVGGKQDVKSEEAKLEEEVLKSARGAKPGAQTISPAQSPASSSLSHQSSGESHLPPPSPAASVVVPKPSQTLPPPGPQVLEIIPSPPQCSPPRPLSPSHYMRRLPPPPGFYLPKEHNYAQLSPLVWRNRYDRAIDNLEKSLRLLNAARRRENRLRQTLLRLRESRLKHTLGRFREGVKGREGRWGRRKVEQGSRARERELTECGIQHGLEESEVERMAEDLSLIEDSLGGAGDWGGTNQSARTSLDEELGYCFYCGRGREEDGGTEEQLGGIHQRTKETQEQRENSARCYDEVKRERRISCQRAEEIGVEAGTEERCYYYYCDNGETKEGEGGLRIVTVELPPKQTPGQPQKLTQPLAAVQAMPCKASVSPVLCSTQLQPLTLQQHLEQQAELHLPARQATGTLHTALQLQDLQALQPAQLQPVQLLQQGPTPQLGTLTVESGSEAEVTIREGEEQQVYWVQEGMEGCLLLLPVPMEDRGRNTTRKDGGVGEPGFQSVLVSEVGFQSPTKEREGQCLETRGRGLKTTGQSEKECSPQLETRTGVVGGDVRERLKEHLEGFQLQLSNEFIN